MNIGSSRLLREGHLGPCTVGTNPDEATVPGLDSDKRLPSLAGTKSAATPSRRTCTSICSP